MLRTSAWVSARYKVVSFGVEALDARAFASDTTRLNSTMVDPVALLQANVALRSTGLMSVGDAASATVGRMTLDVGSRRLVARNAFRNTINAFSGLDVEWTGPSGDHVRSFFVVPVVRSPSDPAALRNAAVEYDLENPRAFFGGSYFASRPFASDVRLELYAFGLHEQDSDDVPSANRRLLTPGFRLLRAAAAGRFDGQLEVMAQVGSSRATSKPDDRRDLRHFAMSLHASLGYRFDARTTPRLALSYDDASGDESPTDDRNGRFDPLFGARRFEFGPTGLYGAVARSNVRTPGVRLELHPRDAVDAFLGARAIWLASSRDAWTTAGLRDASGQRGTFIGQQLEAQIRWQALPGNLAFEIGGAALSRGRFVRAAEPRSHGPFLYGYAQVTATL